MGSRPTDPRRDIAVLGAGAWGTTLAIVLARQGHRVRLWGADEARLARLAHERCNAAYLPGVAFPDSLTTEPGLAALSGCQNILVAVPSGGFRAVVRAVAPALRPDTVLAWATKGLETGTGRRMSEIVEEIRPGHPGALITGPSFAREVAAGLPTALTVVSTQTAVADEVAQWLRHARLRVYTGRDMLGAELCGAIKNVLAIAVGISDGLGFGANARAALITRGLAELIRFTSALGGQRETVMGLAGIGDLVLTCTDDLSRNRRVGLALGRGRQLGDIVGELGQAVEGVASAREVCLLAQAQGVEMPIVEQVHAVLFEGQTPAKAVDALLNRQPRPEDPLAGDPGNKRL
ncbi:MAG: NAD(P)-dependent glycerol-3-phosphate dehydrogenase [Gammaproteobacteria bacterium]|nr:NAD(P)-dependent glycerol-3-phosphate dehydrogenase [Gammaproteobacteria bacterium]